MDFIFEFVVGGAHPVDDMSEMLLVVLQTRELVLHHLDSSFLSLSAWNVPSSQVTQAWQYTQIQVESLRQNHHRNCAATSMLPNY